MRNLLILAPLLFSVSTILAGVAPPGKITISVENASVDFFPATANLFQALDTIDLTIETGDLEISGINLKIATTPGALSITEILPGQFVDSCRWEYFEVRPSQLVRDNDTLELWQITTVSELIPDSTRPLCYRQGGEVPLARLIIQGHSSNEPSGSQQIMFCWESCADNSISDKSGNKLFVSDQVLFPAGVKGDLKLAQPTTDGSEPLLSGAGVPASCINEQNPNRPLRRIDFYIGHLKFQVKVEETEPADSVGE